MALDGYVGQADIKNLKRYWKKKITIITIAAYDVILFPPPMKRKTYCVNFFSENENDFLGKMMHNVYTGTKLLRNAMSG